MATKKATDVENLETDIVVLGAGGSGLAAAVAAAEEGAKVMVLEKRSKAGGNTAMAVGLFACESPVQKRLRIDVSKDECFKIAMNYSHWKINPRIVRAFIDKSGDTIKWLEDRGLKIERIFPAFPNQKHLVWHVPEKWGAGLIDLMLKHCNEHHVQVFYKVGAKKILTDKDGRITGVLAENKKAAICLGLTMLVLLAACAREDMPMRTTPGLSLDCTLEMDETYPVGEPVSLRFVLRNQTDRPLYVLTWYTPLEGIAGDIFQVTRDGEKLPYQGMLALVPESLPAPGSPSRSRKDR